MTVGATVAASAGEHVRRMDVKACMPSTNKNGPAPKGGPTKNRVLNVLNELTKWTVSATALTVLVTRRDTTVMWALIGSIVNVVIGKTLKKLINQQRPGSAWKADPGMPSSHAQSLAYLSTYAAISILSEREWSNIHAQLSAAAIMAASVFMTWLRVASGYHTTAQVSVGFVLGASVSLGWRHWGIRHVLPIAAQHPYAMPLLQATCVVAVAAFAIKTLAGVGQDLDRLHHLMFKRR